MTDNASQNYQRIAEAITYIQTHFKDQPDLDEVARQVHLSPFHFQRLFSEWAGVSPKKFLQYISVEHAKSILRRGDVTLAQAADETGLSGTGRLHDLFVSIEAMTPGDFKKGGHALLIHYSYSETPFGSLIVASTIKGLCYMAFHDDRQQAFADLLAHFPEASMRAARDHYQDDALRVFEADLPSLPRIKLHLRGTAFQLKVWEALLKIPMGSLTTYGKLAEVIQRPKASRAVGTAIGSNPIAFLIPCHRVIRSGGTFGGYMWGPSRKAAIIGWEASQTAAIRDEV